MISPSIVRAVRNRADPAKYHPCNCDQKFNRKPNLEYFLGSAKLDVLAAMHSTAIHLWYRNNTNVLIFETEEYDLGSGPIKWLVFGLMRLIHLGRREAPR